MLGSAKPSRHWGHSWRLQVVNTYRGRLQRRGCSLDAIDSWLISPRDTHLGKLKKENKNKQKNEMENWVEKKSSVHSVGRSSKYLLSSLRTIIISLVWASTTNLALCWVLATKKSYFICAAIQSGRNYYCLHFLDEETEFQKGHRANKRKS